MLRAILGVVVGYIVMGVVVMGGLSAMYMAAGEEWAFEPDVYSVSMGWIVGMSVIGMVAAVAGGLTCAVLSKHSKNAVLALMGIVLVLGLAMALGVAVAGEPAPESLARTEPTAVFDAQRKARQPVWVAFANPIIGAAGVMLGATLVCPNRKQPAAE